MTSVLECVVCDLFDMKSILFVWIFSVLPYWQHCLSSQHSPSVFHSRKFSDPWISFQPQQIWGVCDPYFKFHGPTPLAGACPTSTLTSHTPRGSASIPAHALEVLPTPTTTTVEWRQLGQEHFWLPGKWRGGKWWRG